MQENDITVARLQSASGVPSRTIVHLRSGKSPRISSAAALLRGFSKLLGRDVAFEEVFDLRKLGAIKKRRRSAA
jgi:hypothetical protein